MFGLRFRQFLVPLKRVLSLNQIFRATEMLQMTVFSICEKVLLRTSYSSTNYPPNSNYIAVE